jgi:hypothetical protein
MRIESIRYFNFIYISSDTIDYLSNSNEKKDFYIIPFIADRYSSDYM